MKKVIEFFTNKIVISFIGLVALSILVWFAGPVIKFGDANSAPLESTTARLIVILILVALWGLNNLRIQLMNKKYNNELLDDLGDNQESLGTDMASGQSADEMQQMNQRFTEALSTLKKLKFKGHSVYNSLFQY